MNIFCASNCHHKENIVCRTFIFNKNEKKNRKMRKVLQTKHLLFIVVLNGIACLNNGENNHKSFL